MLRIDHQWLFNNIVHSHTQKFLEQLADEKKCWKWQRVRLYFLWFNTFSVVASVHLWKNVSGLDGLLVWHSLENSFWAPVKQWETRELKYPICLAILFGPSLLNLTVWVMSWSISALVLGLGGFDVFLLLTAAWWVIGSCFSCLYFSFSVFSEERECWPAIRDLVKNTCSPPHP